MTNSIFRALFFGLLSSAHLSADNEITVSEWENELSGAIITVKFFLTIVDDSAIVIHSLYDCVSDEHKISTSVFILSRNGEKFTINSNRFGGRLLDHPRLFVKYSPKLYILTVSLSIDDILDAAAGTHRNGVELFDVTVSIPAYHPVGKTIKITQSDYPLHFTYSTIPLLVDWDNETMRVLNPYAKHERTLVETRE